MEVLSAIIHRVDKQSASTEVHLHLAEADLAIDETVTRVATEVRGLYKRGVVYGVFQPDEETYRFQPLLRECMDQDWADFLPFTQQAMRLLKARMEEKPASAGGYVMFIRYVEQDTDYIFVLMMNDKVGAAVTDRLTLKDSIHLDLGKLYVAARVNLSRWRLDQRENEPGQHKYVSFIRGRRIVSDYFTAFIGCSEITKPAKATGLVIDILHNYAREKNLSAEEKDRHRRIADDYLRACLEEEREASLEQLSVQLNEEAPEDFLEFATAEEYGMGAFFPVDRSTLARLRGVRYDSQQLKIRMSEAYVRGHVTVGDNGSITLNQAPEELMEEVLALL